MKAHADQPKAPGSEADSKPVAKDNLQTLPLPEVEKELGSSPAGLTQAEAQKRLTQYGPNEIAEKKTNGCRQVNEFGLSSMVNADHVDFL